LKEFNIDVEGKVCVDLGSSTGGFTDCLLQHGARKVYAVEKGYGVLEWKIRQDERVVVMERQNALYVALPEQVDVAVIDCGWTKQRFIVPKALDLLKENGIIITLLKPHYEAERHELKKGKVLDDMVEKIRDRVIDELKEMNVKVENIIESPIVGGKGKNKEFLLLITRQRTSQSYG